MVELIVLTVLPFIILIVVWTWTLTVLVVGCVYGGYYWDGTERTGKRLWPWFRRSFCLVPWLRRRYSYKRVYTGEERRDTVVYAVHPHGMLTLGTLMDRLGPDDQHLVAVHSNYFNVPILRDLSLWGGCVDARPETIGGLLARGHSVTLVPGGVREQDHDGERPHQFLEWAYTAWLKPVVPVFSTREIESMTVWKPTWLKPVHDWGMRQWWLRYPVFSFFWARPVPPGVEWKVVYGTAIDPKQHPSMATFFEAYWAELDRIRAWSDT